MILKFNQPNMDTKDEGREGGSGSLNLREDIYHPPHTNAQDNLSVSVIRKMNELRKRGTKSFSIILEVWI